MAIRPRRATPRWFTLILVLLLGLHFGGMFVGRLVSPPVQAASAEPAPQNAQDPQDQQDERTPPTAEQVPATVSDAPADQIPMPVFRTGINFIRVDAIVTDGDGNHVTDLQPSDFEVYEDGELQTVETFEQVEISAVTALDAEPPRGISNRYDVEREAARSDVRVFVIFFDDYHVRWGNGERAADQLKEFLERNLLPADLVGVMFPLTPLLDFDLTRDHERIYERIDNWYGRKYDYEPLNEFESRYAHYPTEVVERLRNEVSWSALRGLFVYLGGIREARKNVLLVSEGYSNYLPPQLRSTNALMPVDPATNPARLDPMAGEASWEQTQEFFSNSMINMDLRQLFSTANRFNTAIYALDPRGLAAEEFDVSQPNISFRTNQRALVGSQDTLRVLAEETDGRALINQNDFSDGLSQMMSDASAYYLLGYTSSQSPTDGEFHEIEVRVNRPGVRVRNRPGFWAVTERDAERALKAPLNEPPKAVDVALGALAEPVRARLVRTWMGTSRADDGRTRVTFVWEPTRGQSSRLGEAQRILVTAMGDAGGAFYRGRVPEQDFSRAGRGRVGSESGGDAQVTSATFEADPGLMHINLAIEGDGGEVLDRDRGEVEIPDFSGPDVVFSTPAFHRARTNLEWQALVDDWEAVPTPAREFRRTERLVLRFEVYAPGTSVPDVEAWMLNRRGDRMYPLPVQVAADGHPNQVDIQPTGLAPGDYVIELTARAAGQDVTELVAFRLQS